MRLDFGPALIIARREVRDQFRDWRIIFPVLGLTIFFPFLMNFTATQILNFVREYDATIIGERLVPFLMMIVGFFPISVSLVIALESFVGEKERASIEPLLNTPLKDWQLYLGKLLSSTVPPLLSSFLGMAVYTGGLVLEHVKLPPLDLMVLIITLTIVQAFVMVSGAVVVSTQATSVRSANLLASFIIIPMALLVQGESLIMFWGDISLLWLATVGLATLGFLLVRVGLAHFRREELLGREIDVLNLKWGWRVFRMAFSGNARNFKEWYLTSVPATLNKLKRSILITTGLAAAGVLVGSIMVNQFSIPLDVFNFGKVDGKLQGLIQTWPMFAADPMLSIWWQNIRALLIGILLGTFSMGILGMLPIVLTMGVTGFLMGLVNLNGVSVLSFFAGFILPHGLFEIPAMIIASASILQAGVILATPTPGKTVGEVWITSLGEWAKIMLGVVIPLLFVAAAVEVWVTPRIAFLLFR